MHFGGPWLKDSGGLRRAARIIKHRLRYKMVVVVGALSDVLEQLSVCARSAANGELDRASETVRQLRERHHAIASALVSGSELQTLFCLLEAEFDALLELVRDVAAIRELTPRTLDNILEFGDNLASRIFAAALADAGMNVSAIDSSALYPVERDFAEQPCLCPQAQSRIAQILAPAISAGRIPVIPASCKKVAHENQGRNQRLHLTPALVASALEAHVIEFWTDVDGFTTADPGLCPEAQGIEELTFEEASELADFAVQGVHCADMRALIANPIPVHVLNLYHPGGKGTRIVRHASTSRRVKAIAARRGVAIAQLRAHRQSAPQLLREIYRVFESHQETPNLLSWSGAGFSLLANSATTLAAAGENLKGTADITWENHKALVAVVGQKIRSSSEILSQALHELAGIKLRLIADGNLEGSLTFLIDDRDTEEAVQRLHRLFFEPKSRESQVPVQSLCQAGESWE